jgi:hypothetical protein
MKFGVILYIEQILGDKILFKFTVYQEKKKQAAEV